MFSAASVTLTCSFPEQSYNIKQREGEDYQDETRKCSTKADLVYVSRPFYTPDVYLYTSDQILLSISMIREIRKEKGLFLLLTNVRV